MKKITSNPYIVGNPIKTKEMFFGREDDFVFIARKIGLEKANQIIILCGERRSGKTSILFQILSGRLGEEFLPVLIDMQILAGIKSDAEFFKAVIETACDTLRLPGLTFASLAERAAGGSADQIFSDFLVAVSKAHPTKVLLFLLDEYELLETRIKENILTESIVHFLSGVLEGSRRISFIFTGSTNLENRRVDFWKSLLGKSIYRKISYLSQDDTRRLIIEPLGEAVAYQEDVIDSIYRLSGGQPFYVQVICQNLVDLLIEEERNDPGHQDLEAVVKDIIENPLPQMIYSWNSLSDWTKFALSSLAGNLADARARSDMNGVYRFLKTSKIVLPFKRERINVFLEEAYQKEFLEKDEESAYAFRMDLYRRWIRKEHSIWKVLKEVNLEVKRQRGWLKYVFLAAAAAAAAGVLLYFVLPGGPGRGGEGAAGILGGPEAGKITGVTVTANRGPFRVSVDGAQPLTSEGQDDKLTIALPPLAPGEHLFSVTLPASGEQQDLRLTVSAGLKAVPVAFKQETAAAKAAGAVYVFTVPPKARIRLNGKDMGVTPKLLSGIPVGAHLLEVELDGYKKVENKIAVKAGQTNLEINLTAAFGFLSLKVTPTAKIFLDGVFLVDTPIVKPVQVPTGFHRLKILNDDLGYSEERDILVTDGGTVTVEAAIERKSK